ncbi:MAG: hypothetical protein LBQ12_06800 [Deltaproteobacteria bacterium]|jgi:hypothetical protein|nr:hypothetical protein [Deltaproteobacteria bacterium]
MIETYVDLARALRDLCKAQGFRARIIKPADGSDAATVEYGLSRKEAQEYVNRFPVHLRERVGYNGTRIMRFDVNRERPTGRRGVRSGRGQIVVSITEGKRTGESFHVVMRLPVTLPVRTLNDVAKVIKA